MFVKTKLTGSLRCSSPLHICVTVLRETDAIIPEHPYRSTNGTFFFMCHTSSQYLDECFKCRYQFSAYNPASAGDFIISTFSAFLVSAAYVKLKEPVITVS